MTDVSPEPRDPRHATPRPKGENTTRAQNAVVSWAGTLLLLAVIIGITAVIVAFVVKTIAGWY